MNYLNFCENQRSKLTALNAIQLYKSASNSVSNNTQENQELSKPICRICMSTNSNHLKPCPCECLGSIGFVHENCLNRWKFVKRDSFCEICKTRFTIKNTKTSNFWRLFKNFFQRKYFGFILRSLLELLAVCPLLYINIINLKNFIEVSEISTDLIFSPMFLFSGYFFYNFLKVAKQNILMIKTVFRLWWSDEDFIVNDDSSSLISLSSSDEDLYEL